MSLVPLLDFCVERHAVARVVVKGIDRTPVYYTRSKMKNLSLPAYMVVDDDETPDPDYFPM